MHHLKKFLKAKACYNNPDNLYTIDLILKRCPRSFQNSNIFEIWLFVFHKLIVTVVEQYFPKQKHKVVSYWGNNNFQNDAYWVELDDEVRNYDLKNMEYQYFLNIFTEALCKHTPIKTSYLRANQTIFFHKIYTKQLRIALGLGML